MNIQGVTISPVPVAPDYQSLGLDGFCGYRFYKPLAEHICARLNPAHILEIGFMLGSSAYCWLSSSNARVISCDIVGDAATDCLKVIRNAQALGGRFANRLTFIPKSSQFIYPDVSHIPFDLAFVDGRHDFQGVTEDLDLCYRLGVRYIYLDDFNGDVSRAWVQGFADRYPPVHGVRFENGSQSNPVDGLLVRRHDQPDLWNVAPPTHVKAITEATNAIAFYGEGRTFARAAAAIKDGIVTPFRADPYIHTWRSRFAMDEGQTEDDYVRLYQPKASEVEKLYEDDGYLPHHHDVTTATHFTSENRARFLRDELTPRITHSAPGGHRIGGILSMLYSKSRAFRMVEQSPVHYDYVFLCRPDLQLERVELPACPAKNTIYTARFPIPTACCDQIAFGDYAAMKAYCSLWDRLEEYIQDPNCSFHPETLLRYHLDRCGVHLVDGAFVAIPLRPPHLA